MFFISLTKMLKDAKGHKNMMEKNEIIFSKTN